MTNRIRILALLLALALALASAPVLAQSEEEDPGSAGEAAEDLGEGIDPSDPDAPVDSSDPDAPVDPSDPDAPIDPTNPDAPIDPTDPDAPIDPSDPDADPGEPLEPSEPGQPGAATDPDGIELPEPSEPEEGGFAEIQLLPDPVPEGGQWTVTNKKGLVTCDSLGNTSLPATSQTGRITVKEEGRVLVGRSLFTGQDGPVRMRWNPELERYEGKVTVAAPGGQTILDFHAYVQKRNLMSGDMIAKVTIDSEGVKERCRVARGLVFKRGD